MDTKPSGGAAFDRRLLLGAAGLAGVAAFSRLAHAGPLTPPAGPVSSTGKTLTSIEPRIEINSTNTPGDGTGALSIHQPGSYYLSANTFIGTNSHGLHIVATDVTIDFMGFEFVGSNSPGFSPILIAPGFSGVVIRNGFIRGWAGPGVYPTGASSRVVCENLHVNGAQTGLILGQHSLARACLIEGATGDGISVGLSSAVEDCIIRSAGGNGIYSTQNDTIFRNCAAYGCSFAGFYAGSGSIIENCMAAANLLTGFRVQDQCVVRNCVAAFNGTGGLAGAGITVAGTRNQIDQNSMTLNDRGLVVSGSANIATRNFASGNNRNWDIAAGNAGQYVQAATGGAVSGSTGGVPIGSTDPWINFTL